VRVEMSKYRPETPAQMRERAARARGQAWDLSDDDAATSLFRIAAELEAKAEAICARWKGLPLAGPLPRGPDGL
jgi:hypothetical protein